ncbi:MAG TPA: hypothetical protein VHC90_12495 [Bryobacteraceae bacterium]|nr:hypothetical protein [Bryobacteraceae bacterium]
MPTLNRKIRRIWRAMGLIAADVEDIGGSVVETVRTFPKPEFVEGPTEPIDASVRFEHSDINAFAVVLTGACVLGGSLILIALLYFYFTALANHRASVSAAPLALEAHGIPLPPEPRLQRSPAGDLAEKRASENALLDHYWWVDRPKGIVGMPIDRAIQILTQRGIPPQKAPADLKLFPPQTGDRGVGFEDTVAPEPR